MAIARPYDTKEFKLHIDAAITAAIDMPMDDQPCFELAKIARETPLREIFARIIKNDETAAWNILWARIQNHEADDTAYATEWLEREEKTINVSSSVNFLTLLSVVKKELNSFPNFHERYESDLQANKYLEQAEKQGGLFASLLLVQHESGLATVTANEEPLENLKLLYAKIVTCYQRTKTSSQPHCWYACYEMLAIWREKVAELRLKMDSNAEIFRYIDQLPLAWVNAAKGGHSIAATNLSILIHLDASTKDVVFRWGSKSGSYMAAIALGSSLHKKADPAALEEARAWLIPLVKDVITLDVFTKNSIAKLLLENPGTLNDEILAKCVYIMRFSKRISATPDPRIKGVNLPEFFLSCFRSRPTYFPFIYMAAMMVPDGNTAKTDILKALNQYAIKFPEEFLISVKMDDSEQWKILKVILNDAAKQALKSCFPQLEPELIKRETTAAFDLRFFPRVLTNLVNDFVRPRFYIPQELRDILELPPETIVRQARGLKP